MALAHTDVKDVIDDIETFLGYHFHSLNDNLLQWAVSTSQTSYIEWDINKGCIDKTRLKSAFLFLETKISVLHNDQALMYSC